MTARTILPGDAGSRRAPRLMLLATLACIAGPADAAPSRDTSAGQAFAALSARYVASIAENTPTEGTLLGDHRFDDRIGDVSATGRSRIVAADRRMLADLVQIDRARLARDDQVDAAMLDNALRFDLWRIETLQDWAWDAQIYNDAAGSALYGLAARDFASWPVRLRAATRRMEAMSAYLAQVRAVLVPARVPAIVATTVARQNAGIAEIAETMLVPHAGSLGGIDRARFDAALAVLKTAVAKHQKWLDAVLVPQARGDFRLGARLYDQKMRFALVSDVSRSLLKSRANAALAVTRAEMYRLARNLLAARGATLPLPADPDGVQQQAVIEAALQLSYDRRPARAALMADATATLAEATAFVREHALITLPDAPVRIITMPRFQQGVSVAYCDSPGALEKQLATFYAISPIPIEWSDAQATSFLSEYNDYMIHDLSIHEAMPGHYVQIAHANQNRSVLRAVLSSGPFVEGWAVYAEGMMADQGYLGGDPLFRLTVLKMRLRSITNTLLDIGIHAEGMTRAEAMTLMMRGGFQQEREAAGKWVRASLSSTQLLSYFTGYSEHMAIREEARRRLGARFDLKAYNDAVLAHGSPPARYARELMFDLPIG